VQAACGYLSHAPKTLHFGLGDSPRFDKVVVTWPGGRTQELAGVNPDALNDVVETRD
jgi:hypothetical protein